MKLGTVSWSVNRTRVERVKRSAIGAFVTLASSPSVVAQNGRPPPPTASFPEVLPAAEPSRAPDVTADAHSAPLPNSAPSQWTAPPSLEPTSPVPPPYPDARYTVWSGIPAAASPASYPAPSGVESAPDVARRERPPMDCALGEFCVGPVVTPGLPNLIGVGIHARQSPYVGFAVDYQFLPTLTVDSTSIATRLLTAEVRLFPLGGPIWLGGGFAHQSVTASTEVEYAGRTVPLDGSMGVPLLKLGLGFLGRSGLVVGIDVGFGVPLGSRDVVFDVPSSSNALVQAEIDRQKAEVQDSVDSVVGFLPVVPQVNLLRLGYLF